AIAEVVGSDASLAAAHGEFMNRLGEWWGEHRPELEALAPTRNADGQWVQHGNVYALRRALLASAVDAFAGNTLLTKHQVRGALAGRDEGRLEIHRRQRLGRGADSRCRHPGKPVPRAAGRTGHQACAPGRVERAVRRRG